MDNTVKSMYIKRKQKYSIAIVFVVSFLVEVHNQQSSTIRQPINAAKSCVSY